MFRFFFMGRIAVLIFVCIAFQAAAQKTRTTQTFLGYGWAATSVNTAIFRKNSVVSHNGWQYAAYYDSTGQVILAKRKHGSKEWGTRQTRLRGNVRDAHNVISIMVDGNDFLHMAWDHHNTSLKYCKSIRAGSLEMGPLAPMIGHKELSVSYPEFHRLPSGDLLFAYRDGGSGNGDMVLNYYETRMGKWRRVHDSLIDGEGERNAYWQLYASPGGVIHLSWVWRESPDAGSNHDIAYAVSHDRGKTWQRADGTTYDIPIRYVTAGYAVRIPENSDLMNQTSMTADRNERPYIATYFQAATDSCPQYYVIYNRDGDWELSRASDRKLDFDLSGTGTRSLPVSRPQIFYSGDKNRPRLFMLYRDDEQGGAARLASAATDSLRWSARDLSLEALGRWEPTYDTEMWRERGRLHVFLQATGQGPGERAEAVSPQRVHILEVRID